MIWVNTCKLVYSNQKKKWPLLPECRTKADLWCVPHSPPHLKTSLLPQATMKNVFNYMIEPENIMFLGSPCPSRTSAKVNSLLDLGVASFLVFHNMRESNLSSLYNNLHGLVKIQKAALLSQTDVTLVKDTTLYWSHRRKSYLEKKSKTFINILN